MPNSSEDLRSRLAERLRAHREGANLTREQLAEAAGVRSDYIRDLETVRGGDAGPGVFLLARIAAALKTSIDRLVGLSDQGFEGYGVVDMDAVEAIQKARTEKDIARLWWPAKYRWGVGLTSSCRIVPDEELTEIEARCNARIVEILGKGGSAKTRRRT